MAERTESVVLDFEIDMGDSIETIESLTKANKELREERKKLNLDTADGQKRVQEINAQLDKNTSKIVGNTSAIEKQRANIGNYQSALSSLNPQLGQMAGLLSSAAAGAETLAAGTASTAAGAGLLTVAFKAVTATIKTAVRASLAFIATPLGAFLTLLVGAFKLLQSYLGGTQEGMDKITSVTRPLVALFDRLTGVVQQLGGRLFRVLGDAIQNPVQAFKDLGQAIVDNVIKRFEALSLFGPAIAKIFRGKISDGFKDLGNAVIQAGAGVENGIDKIGNAASSLSNFVDEAIAQGQRLDELQKQIERGEISQIIRLKELNLLVKQNKTIVEDETKSFAERTSAALRARTAQNEILSNELNLLDKRIEKLKLQQSLNDTSREDEKELAELEARRFEVQATNAEQSIEFDKKINELRVKNNLALAEQAALERAIMRERNQLDVTTDDPLIGAFETRVNTITNLEDRLQDDLAKRRKEADAAERQRLKAGAKYVQEIEAAKLGIISNAVGAAANLYEQDSEGFKILATAQALINTYLAATAALASGSKINPIFGIISAAAAVASGLASVAQINGIQFAEGGWTGPGDKMKPVGVVHADEYVVPKRIKNNPMATPHINALEGMRLRPYADGGLVVSTSTGPVNQTMELLNIVKNLPPQVLDVRESMRVQKRIQVKESLSKR